MATTTQKRAWWWNYRCNTERMVRVPFPGNNRTWNLPVADASVPAWLTFIDLMEKHGYLFLESAGGTYNCRKIGGTNSWSLHAYGIAVDLNPSKNPYGTTRHDYPQGFIDDVLATGMFKWLNTFDPMHWEIDVPPDEIRQLPVEEPDMSLPIDSTSHKEQIRHVQEMLGVAASGTWDFKPAVSALAQRSGTGDPKGQNGELVNGRMYTHLLGEFIQRAAPAPTTGIHDHDGTYVKNVVVSR